MFEVHRGVILGHSLKGMDIYYISPDEETLKEAIKKYSHWLNSQFAKVDHSVDQTAIENT